MTTWATALPANRSSATKLSLPPSTIMEAVTAPLAFAPLTVLRMKHARHA